ncbi:MAG: hypothetical protein JZU53_03665 [Paludibacter sp.]|nr:hypothetical protein [Paludibacter sp.]
MTKSILCTVVFGIVVGVTAFFVPKMLLGIVLFFAAMRLFHCCCHRHHSRGRFYMADKIRTMSDEEYAEFKVQMVGGCCNSGYQHSSCKSHKKSECCSKSKETTK